MYRYVIDEVINQVRGDFEDMGIDESVLQELQRVRYHNYSINLILTVIKSWESKVARSRVANFGFIRDEPFYDDEHSDMPPPSSNGVHANDNVDNNSHPILQYPHNQDVNICNIYVNNDFDCFCLLFLFYFSLITFIVQSKCH